jgi:hypothetical protein
VVACTSLIRLALDANGCRLANDSLKGTNSIMSFEEKRLERALDLTIFNHHPWMEDDVMLCHCDGVFRDNVLHLKAHIVPTYCVHTISRSERSRLFLSLLAVELVQHGSYVLLRRIQTGPDLIVVVLHTREARVADWETKAVRIRIEGTETSLVLVKTEYFFSKGLSRVKQEGQVNNDV